jgi:hypothetical protein
LTVGWRRKLNDCAWRFSERSRRKYSRRTFRPLPPKQQAIQIQNEIAQLNNAIDMLNRYATYYYLDTSWLDLTGPKPLKAQRRDAKALHRAQWPLWHCRDHLQHRLDQLNKPQRSGLSALRGNRNAEQIHTQYWKELTRLWLLIVPSPTISRHKHLRNFLRACSEPMFPTATTDKALRAFTDRYLPQSKS